MQMNRILPIAAGVILIGCNQPVTLAPPAHRSAPNHIIDASTKVGETVRATVGNHVLKVKDYWVVSESSDAMTPSSAFTFTGGPNTIAVMPGQSLKIAGETVLEGRKHTVLKVPNQSIFLLADSQTGALSPKVLNSLTFNASDAMVMMWDFKSTPANITFSNSKLETIASSQTYINYEFIYSGKSGNNLNFLYREFTAADLAKPAFFQNVSYEVGQKEIEFKTIKLELIEASSNAVIVKILAL